MDKPKFPPNQSVKAFEGADLFMKAVALGTAVVVAAIAVISVIYIWVRILTEA